MKRAFVTGGAGFLARHLIGQLVEGGWKVVAFDLETSGAAAFEPLGVALIQGDITEPESCERVIPEGVDAVFHVAASTSHWKLGDKLQTSVNVDGTRHVASAARNRNAGRFIHTSSIAAYGFQPERITEEVEPTALESSINYFRTKRLAELQVHGAIREGLDAVIVNPSNIIGAYDPSGWSRFFPLIEQGRLPGIPPGRSTFCHAPEVARAHIAAFERGRCGEHYILGGADATFLEVVQQVAELLGRKAPSRPIPAWVAKMVGRLSLWGSYVTRREPDLTPEKATLLSGNLVCSCEKAERELGYRPVPLSTMLEDCHRWMLEAGLLESSPQGGGR
jgi:nucleoside-diphosphate-sugar epimerase